MKNRGIQQEIPRMEHPRPQLERESWETLNGLWEFDFDFSQSGIDRRKWDDLSYPHEILVPFCPESRLSGIAYTDFIQAAWYRRSFSLSADKMKGKVLLHFGAVDYECHIWINGKKAGEHKGGYTSFTLDISPFVTEGENTISVYAVDNMRNGRQASGKQSDRYESHGCFYTRTTGIWQSVWVEYVPCTYIRNLKINTDAFNGSVDITAELEDGDGAKLTVLVKKNGICEKKETVFAANQRAKCSIKMDNPKLWSPDSPELYDLVMILEKGHEKDNVKSYFGIRTIEWKNHKIYLNGKPIFLRLILDQGFYPDGEGGYECRFRRLTQNPDGIREIHRGILDFVRLFQETEKRLGLEIPVSGRDAYAPMIGVCHPKNKKFMADLEDMMDEEHIT